MAIAHEFNLPASGLPSVGQTISKGQLCAAPAEPVGLVAETCIPRDAPPPTADLPTRRKGTFNIEVAKVPTTGEPWLLIEYGCGRSWV